MKKKEDKSHSKVPSLIDLNDYANEHNEVLLRIFLVGGIGELSRWAWYIYAIENMGLKLSKNVKTRNVNLYLFKCMSHIYILWIKPFFQLYNKFFFCCCLRYYKYYYICLLFSPMDLPPALNKALKIDVIPFPTLRKCVV